MQTISQDLLRRYVERRDAEAFRELVAQFQELVYGTCRRVLGDVPEVDDAVQETFLKLARKADEVRSNVGAWLHSCARTTALDSLRVQLPRRKKEIAMTDQQPVESVRGDAERAEASALIDACLSELDDQDRDVVVSYFFVRASQEEIAHRIGVTQGSVQRRLERILEALRRKFIRRGVVAPLALATVLEECADASQVPAHLAASLDRMDPGAALGSSGGLTAASAKISAFTVVCTVSAAMAVLAIGSVCWKGKAVDVSPQEMRAVSSDPIAKPAGMHSPLFGYWDLSRKIPDSFFSSADLEKMEWRWHAADGEVPAGVRVLAGKGSTEFTTEWDLPADIPVVATAMVAALRDETVATNLGWAPARDNRLTKRGQWNARIANPPIGPHSAVRSYLFHHYSVIELDGHFMALCTFTWEDQDAPRHISFRMSENLILESFEYHQSDGSDIPAAYRDLDGLRATYPLVDAGQIPFDKDGGFHPRDLFSELEEPSADAL